MKRLRHEDPLSPILFVLVANVFTWMINLGKTNNVIQGLGNFDNEIISLQYADDTMIFSVTDIDKVRNLKLHVFLFEDISGLKINFSKT